MLVTETTGIKLLPKIIVLNPKDGYKNKRFRSMRGEKALISYILWAFQGEKALDKHSGNEYK